MAISFMRIQRIKKSEGRNCIAAAAYRAAEEMYHNILKKNYDYGYKKGLIHSEIQLPENAPESFKNRQTLWNAVEEVELKNAKANTAIEVMIALPRELKKETQIKLVREFCQQTFVKNGQVADWSIHLPDEKQQNPHVHILLTTRPFKKNGEWGYKETYRYKYDDNGQRIPIIDPETGEQKIGERGRREWEREKIVLCDWNDKNKNWIKQIRSSWQEVANTYLDPEHQIDMRSYKERYPNPEDRPQAQKHEGVAARKIDERYKIWREQFIEDPTIDLPEPESSEVCEYNRFVKESNSLLKQIKEIIKRENRWSDDKFKNIFFTKQENEYLQRKAELFTTITNKQWECYYGEEKKRILSDMRFSFSKWIGKNRHFIEQAINKIYNSSFKKMSLKEFLEEERKRDQFNTLLLLAEYDQIRKNIADLPQETKEKINNAYKDSHEYQFLQERIKQLEKENSRRTVSVSTETVKIQQEKEKEVSTDTSLVKKFK